MNTTDASAICARGVENYDVSAVFESRRPPYMVGTDSGEGAARGGHEQCIRTLPVAKTLAS